VINNRPGYFAFCGIGLQHVIHIKFFGVFYDFFCVIDYCEITDQFLKAPIGEMFLVIEFTFTGDSDVDMPQGFRKN